MPVPHAIFSSADQVLGAYATTFLGSSPDASLPHLLPRPDAAVTAAAAIQITISHCLVRTDDADDFRAQPHQAAGTKHRTD